MHGYISYQQQQQPQSYHHPNSIQIQMSVPVQQLYKKDNKRNSDLGRISTRPATIDSIPEAKKARLDNANLTSTTPQQPTKVVSLRNIPNDITDLQIVLMALEFGDIVNLLYIKAKGQALIEFGTLNDANSMISHFRSQLTEQSLLKSIEAAHSSYQQLTIETNRIASTNNTISLGKDIKMASVNGGDGCVAKALVTNVVYPVSIDALYQIFSKYGNVLKIILTNNGALVQMKDELQMQQAMHNLNGRNMYNTYTGGCNFLNLQPSPHRCIDVKYNNSKSWDYTNPLLLMIDSSSNMATTVENPLLPVPMHQQMSIQASNSYNALSSNAVAAAAAAASTVTGYSMQGMDMSGRSCVVQVCNFPEQISNPDALFTLFGVYGDILRVKIMFNRRDNALLQFKTYEQALIAVAKMDKVKLWDRLMQVGLSKFPEIQIPVKNDGGLAKDFTNSPLHRFKKPGSKNFYNIYQPNQSLHLSNISPQTTQENLEELFKKFGDIANFKWLNKEGNKMALLEMQCIEEAVVALISLHNYQLSGAYLRVNFAK